MNFLYNAAICSLLSISLICQEQVQPEIKLSEENSQKIELIYRMFHSQNVGFQSAILTSEQVDEKIARYDREAFIAQINSYIEQMTSLEYYKPMQAAAVKLAILIQKLTANELVAINEIALLQAELFIYARAIEIEILNLFTQLLNEGKSIQECQDVKDLLMHILVTT